jgi:hypothetical protein
LLAGDRFQPRILPEEQATGLATAVGAAITSGFEMDSMVHAASANREHCVTSLVRPLVDLELLAAESEHLGHEGHAVETPVAVKGAQNFALAADFHPIAGTKL